MNVRDPRFPLVDSLRAIAALSVLVFHVAFFSGAFAEDSLVRPFAARLDVGVAIFFLVSGFLLYRPFVRARLEGEPRPRTGAYAWRRFLRIAPGYWVALTLVALWLARDEVFTASGVFTYYGFAQIYDADTVTGGIPQAWTLCVEVTFYALLPLWALAMRTLPLRTRESRLTGELAGLALLFALSAGYKAVVLASVDPSAPASQPWVLALPTYLDQFAIGMALAVASAWYAGAVRLPSPLRLVERHSWLPWAVALVAFWFVSTRIGLTGSYFTERPSGLQWVERHYLYAIVAVGMLLPAVFGRPDRGAVRRVLGHPVPAYLGLISYGIYLYHRAVLDQLHRWDLNEAIAGSVHPYLAWTAIGLAVSIVLAAASYHLLERPVMRMRSRVAPGADGIDPVSPAEGPAGR